MNPPKKGHLSTTVGHLFSKPVPHMKDEYDRKRELEYVKMNNQMSNVLERKTREEKEASRATIQKY
mgnify:FL=1